MRAVPWLIALLAAIVAGVGCRTFQPGEPSYQGKSLSAWLRDYERTEFANDPPGTWTPAWTEEDRQVRARALYAVREIGTNAIPCLLRMVVSDGWGVGHLGVLGFQALGPAGKPAVPALVALMQEPQLTQRATVCPALGAIGPEAAEAVPVLLKYSDPWTAGPTALLAVPALREIHMHPELVVPVFTALLATNASWGHQANAYIETLGSFGHQSEPAVPVIRLFLNAQEESVRICATNALSRINGQGVFKQE